MINGNTSGLKEYILENLDKLYSTKIEKGKIINQEIVDYISEISNKRVEKTEDVLKEGQNVRVKVISMESEDKFNLSMKTLN